MTCSLFLLPSRTFSLILSLVSGGFQAFLCVLLSRLLYRDMGWSLDLHFSFRFPGRCAACLPWLGLAWPCLWEGVPGAHVFDEVTEAVETCEASR